MHEGPVNTSTSMFLHDHINAVIIMLAWPHVLLLSHLRYELLGQLTAS
jgi:hypothetical protein